MRRAHFILGVIMVIAFVLTGQYMDRVHDHLVGMPDGPRMLYRTRHIFILLTGLLHLGLGAYLTPRRVALGRIGQRFGSALITVASGLFVVAFFREPQLADLETPLSHWAAYAVLAGVLLHVASAVGDRFESSGA